MDSEKCLARKNSELSLRILKDSCVKCLTPCNDIYYKDMAELRKEYRKKLRARGDQRWNLNVE